MLFLFTLRWHFSYSPARCQRHCVSAHLTLPHGTRMVCMHWCWGVSLPSELWLLPRWAWSVLHSSHRVQSTARCSPLPHRVLAPCAVYCSMQSSATPRAFPTGPRLICVICLPSGCYRIGLEPCDLRGGLALSSALVADTTSRLFLWGRSQLVCPLSCSMQRSAT